MSTLDITETFPVAASPDRVFAYLTEPRLVVVCLAGASLEEVIDERHFTGNIKVKVGPVTVAYKGKAEFTVLDAAAHRMELTARGAEKAGSGSAKMVMTGVVGPAADGGSLVTVEAHVDVVGRIVQLGRGMIKGVSDQLFQQFVACVRGHVEAVPADAPSGADDAANATASAAAEAAIAEAPLTPGPLPPASGTPKDAGSAATPLATPPPLITTQSGQSFNAPMAYRHEPVRVLPLIFRSLWTSIRRFFGRLFGRSGR